MLRDIGCTYVIIGHSERRADHGETDALVKAKAEAAISAELSVIICVGETEKERDAGKTNTVVARQIKGSVPKISSAANTVIAYEPVGAIGTGKTPSAADRTSLRCGSCRNPGFSRSGSHAPALWRFRDHLMPQSSWHCRCGRSAFGGASCSEVLGHQSCHSNLKKTVQVRKTV